MHFNYVLANDMIGLLSESWTGHLFLNCMYPWRDTERSVLGGMDPSVYIDKKVICPNWIWAQPMFSFTYYRTAIWGDLPLVANMMSDLLSLSYLNIYKISWNGVCRSWLLYVALLHCVSFPHPSSLFKN